LMAALQRIHKLYNRPIWITEFAPAAWDSESAQTNYIKPPMVETFMKDLFPMLQSTSYIERYAWFSGAVDDRHLGCSALFECDGSLTDLGRLFAADGVAAAGVDRLHQLPHQPHRD
jgi:Glycosyl hydrolase catalytic core